MNSYPKSEAKEEKDLFSFLMYSLKLRNRFFPYPNYPSNKNKDVMAYVCPLDAPYFIERSEITAANPIRSMNYPGWLIFKAFLQGQEKRVDVNEEKLFRDIVESE